MQYTYPIGIHTITERYGIGERYVIELDDKIRRQHMDVPGQTGTGKSTFLVNLMLADFLRGRGFAFLDPNGQTSEMIAALTPPERMKDTLYLDPMHPAKVVTYNPLPRVPTMLRHTLATHITMAFKRRYADVWGPRMDNIMKMGLHLLLEVPDTNLRDLGRLLLEDEYRETLLLQCKEAHIVKYWRNDFHKTIPARERATAIQPITSKLSEFEYNPILRDIFAQRSTIDIPYIINNRKVLICNLSKVMGEDPSDILGSLLLAGFQQAAQGRETIPEEQRQDFTLYVDEFQNFTTSAFATMLSEARKYRLNLVLAHQYMDQLPEGIPQAIMGNVGTTVAFRLGPNDSTLFAKHFDVDERDLLDLPNYHAFVRTQGLTKKVATFPPAVPRKGLARLRAVKRFTRDYYSRPRLKDEPPSEPPPKKRVQSTTRRRYTSSAKKKARGA